MTTDTATTLTDDLHEALTAEAEAWADMERLKLTAASVEAGTAIDIRKLAAETGEKLTEATIAARVEMSKHLHEARTNAINAELRYRLMKADVAQAEAVVSLHKAGLYASAGIQR